MTSSDAKQVLEQLPFSVTLVDAGSGQTVFQNAVGRSEDVAECDGCDSEQEGFNSGSVNIQMDDGRMQTIVVGEPRDVRGLRCREKVAMRLLRDVFPLHIQDILARVAAENLPNDAGLTGTLHQDVTVAFIDVVGYTSMASKVSPRAVMTFLNKLFALLDELTDRTGVQKIETSGDCYIVAAGLDERTGSSPRAAANSVLAFAEMALAGTREMKAPNGQAMRIRVGVHTGPCVSGIVGVKVPKFGLFGDTMNTASRMESTGQVGAVQASESTYRLVSAGEGRLWVPTGGINVKGKGTMQTYVWTPPVHPDALAPHSQLQMQMHALRRLNTMKLQFRSDLLRVLGTPRRTRHASIDE